MPEDLDFEVRMPTTWNKRTVFIGGGGFDGSITTSAFSPGVAQAGYATIATNHGHNADVTPGATFALDQGMLQDYAYLAVPRVLASAKAILRGRYGSDFDTTKFVYEGCSGGGRQGLIEAQRYPELFDGVISRAPANAFTPQFLWYQKVQKALAQPGAGPERGEVSGHRQCDDGQMRCLGWSGGPHHHTARHVHLRPSRAGLHGRGDEFVPDAGADPIRANVVRAHRCGQRAL
jgi:feruloyl esterase